MRTLCVYVYAQYIYICTDAHKNTHTRILGFTTWLYYLLLPAAFLGLESENLLRIRMSHVTYQCVRSRVNELNIP